MTLKWGKPSSSVVTVDHTDVQAWIERNSLFPWSYMLNCSSRNYQVQCGTLKPEPSQSLALKVALSLWQGSAGFFSPHCTSVTSSFWGLWTDWWYRQEVNKTVLVSLCLGCRHAHYDLSHINIIIARSMDMPHKGSRGGGYFVISAPHVEVYFQRAGRSRGRWSPAARGKVQIPGGTWAEDDPQAFVEGGYPEDALYHGVRWVLGCCRGSLYL